MRTRGVLQNVLLALASTLLSLGAVEIALRVLPATGKYLDYGDAYRSDDVLGPGGFLRENFAGQVANGYGGTVRWRNNAQGFRNETEFQIPPPANTYRILSLGDSFTGGYRVGQDQTFSSLIEHDLAARHPGQHIEVIVSVIEDPLTGLYYLASRGIEYRPNLVLLGITLGNDLAQVYAQMGQKYALRTESPFVARLADQDAYEAWVARIEALTMPPDSLTPRGSSVGASRPVWADVYPWWPRKELRLVTLVSQVRRRFLVESPQTVVSNWEEYVTPRLFDSNGLGLFLRRPPNAMLAAYGQLFDTLSALSRLCRSRNVELLVVIFPQRFQVQDRDWEQTVAVYGLRSDRFDLRLPNRQIADFCDTHRIRCLDPLDTMRAVHVAMRKSLYLPNHDMHWNALGHRALTTALAPVVEGIVSATAPPRP